MGPGELASGTLGARTADEGSVHFFQILLSQLTLNPCQSSWGRRLWVCACPPPYNASKDKSDPHQRFPSMTLCNGGIALVQAHIASLLIFVSQWVAFPFLSLLYLTSTKYGQTFRLSFFFQRFIYLHNHFACHAQCYVEECRWHS